MIGHQVFCYKCTPLGHPSLSLVALKLVGFVYAPRVNGGFSLHSYKSMASWRGRPTVFSIGRHKFLPQCVKFWWPCLLLRIVFSIVLLCTSPLKSLHTILCLGQHFCLLGCYKIPMVLSTLLIEKAHKLQSIAHSDRAGCVVEFKSFLCTYYISISDSVRVFAFS